jgi:hypothetical protein
VVRIHVGEPNKPLAPCSHEDEKEVLEFANAQSLASIGRLFTTLRSRIAEDALSGAVERGIRQIVILGAGLDTFALRNPHGARQIRIYEVDDPATRYAPPHSSIAMPLMPGARGLSDSGPSVLEKNCEFATALLRSYFVVCSWVASCASLRCAADFMDSVGGSSA